MRFHDVLIRFPNVSAPVLIESSKARMYQRFCSPTTQKCEFISSFAHRELKSANVSALLLIEIVKSANVLALLLIESSKVRMHQLFCSSRAPKVRMYQLFCSSRASKVLRRKIYAHTKCAACFHQFILTYICTYVRTGVHT